MRNGLRFALFIGLVLMVALILVIFVPDVNSRVMSRVENWRTMVFYYFNPPDEVVFKPNERAAIDAMVQGTLHALTPSITITSPIPTITPSPASTVIATTPTTSPTATPSKTPTPLPTVVVLSGVKYFDQHEAWNYCAPANLAMALSYWGWTGSRADVGKVVKPFEKDKNVMPYELANYVEDKTNLEVIVRSGGTAQLLKALIAARFTPLIEKGTFITETLTGKLSWMGHYQVLTGFNDQAGIFIAQDSYFKPDFPVKYDVLLQEWRSMNFIFLVVYPTEQRDRLFAVLNEYADSQNAEQIALNRSSEEIYTLADNDRFFAWYNRGTSLVHLLDYNGAATAYDEAFRIYEIIPKDKRPYRIVWYQTGPYYAYFYTQRYADVVNLATQTIDYVSEPFIEESFYWRAKALAAQGNIPKAVDDLRVCLKYHPGFSPCIEELQRLGAL
jgi:tetratricopeptide (TPR) repeat protein